MKPALPYQALLVTGSHWYLGWHLPRLLHRGGARVTLIAPRAQPLRRSRFVASWREVSPDTASLEQAVRSHLRDQAYHMVVFTEQSVVERLAADVDRSRWLPWLRPDVAEAIQTKTGFHAWAEARELPVPPSLIATSPEEARAWVEHAQGETLMKCNGRHAGNGVRRIGGGERVVPVWAGLESPRRFLVQAFIPGPVGVTELVLDRGRVVAWFASVKERTRSEFGPSIMRRMVHPPGMADLAERVAAATGFDGLCGFDWVQDAATGRLFVLEFHPRATSGFGSGGCAGVDIPAALADLMGGRRHAVRAPRSETELARAPVCCYFPAHAWHALTCSPADLRYWLPGACAVSWGNIPFDDPGVLAGLAAACGRRLARRKRARIIRDRPD